MGMLERLAPLHRRRPYLDSRDAEEALSRLGGVCERFDIGPSTPGEFFLTIRGVRVSGSAIVNIHSGAPIRLVAEGSPGQYRILLPLRRGCEMIVGDREVGCHPRRAAIVSPDREHAVWSESGSERLWLTVDSAAVARVASALLGEGIDRPVEFAPSIDLGRREGRSIFNGVVFAAQELSDEASLFSSPRLRSELEELIVTALLLGQPHSYSDRLAPLDRQISPRDVVRAVDYIRANLQVPITLQDLADAAGVPGRTLRQHFHRVHGIPPMAYLRNARLDRARALLLNGHELTVTEAALRAGFDHLGRFAVGYRRRFGEMPSQTRPPRLTAAAAGPPVVAADFVHRWPISDCAARRRRGIVRPERPGGSIACRQR